MTRNREPEFADIYARANGPQRRAIDSYLHADGLWPHECVQCVRCGVVREATRGSQPSVTYQAQALCRPCQVAARRWLEE